MEVSRLSQIIYFWVTMLIEEDKEFKQYVFCMPTKLSILKKFTS